MAGEKLFITNATQHGSGFENSFPFKPTWHTQNPSVFYIILIVGIALVIIVLVVGMIIRWFTKVQRYNKLRHYLIPVYSYDPNEEENWDEDFMIEEISVLNPRLQDYKSIDIESDL